MSVHVGKLQNIKMALFHCIPQFGEKLIAVHIFGLGEGVLYGLEVAILILSPRELKQQPDVMPAGGAEGGDIISTQLVCCHQISTAPCETCAPNWVISRSAARRECRPLPFGNG